MQFGSATDSVSIEMGLPSEFQYAVDLGQAIIIDFSLLINIHTSLVMATRLHWYDLGRRPVLLFHSVVIITATAREDVAVRVVI